MWHLCVVSLKDLTSLPARRYPLAKFTLCVICEKQCFDSASYQRYVSLVLMEGFTKKNRCTLDTERTTKSYHFRRDLPSTVARVTGDAGGRPTRT